MAHINKKMSNITTCIKIKEVKENQEAALEIISVINSTRIGKNMAMEVINSRKRGTIENSQITDCKKNKSETKILNFLIYFP